MQGWSGATIHTYAYGNRHNEFLPIGKDSHIWIQGYGAKRGREEEIITAAEAAYDAGARTILSWSFGGAEANNYRSENPSKTQWMTEEAFRRIKSMDRDRVLAENRAKFKK